MARDYFKGMGSNGPDGSFAQRRTFPAVGDTVLYAGEPVRVIKVEKGQCAADISGPSLPHGPVSVGLAWLLPSPSDARRR